MSLINQLYEGYCKMPLLWKESLCGLSQFKETKINSLIGLEDTTFTYKRLGKLAEDLFSIWIKQQSKYTIVFENLQIIDQKQTIGELDICLLDNIQNKHIHIELVTKFYLYNPDFDCNDMNAWIGPNRNDSLSNKINKLKGKQLPLLNKPITKQLLKPYNLNIDTMLQQVCFKAWLFTPINFNQQLITFNPECIAGHYMTLKTFKKLYINTKEFFCPTKQDWLRFPKTQKKWFPFSNIEAQIKLFMEAEQAIMVWVKKTETFERIIIVPYNEF